MTSSCWTPQPPATRWECSAQPQTFGAIARVGPIAGHTREVQQLLETPSHTAYVAVALATEMAVTEVLELQEGLQRQLGRDLTAVVVNALLPRRFTAEELAPDRVTESAGESRRNTPAVRHQQPEQRRAP